MAEVPDLSAQGVGISFGIASPTFVVVDVSDGSRHVVPQVCLLNDDGTGHLQSPRCEAGNMDAWRVASG